MDEIKIIVVDDEPDIVEIIKIYLQKHGYTVRGFMDSEEALFELRDNFYDIAIIDYRMPKISGLDLLIEAKKNNSYSYGILITAYSSEKKVKEFKSKNLVSKIVEKPIDLNLLKTIVDEAVEECKKKL